MLLTVIEKKKEKLSKCETLTAGNLLFSAEDKMDERVLIHICGRDLVASEAMYHQSCYKRYTSYLYKKHTQGSEENPYKAGYDHFCKSVVEERLLKKHEVLRLSRLNELFKAIVKEREGTDISAYTVYCLKARLQKSHPCLKFLKSSKNYLVFVEDLCAEEVIPDVATQQSSSSDQSDDNNEDDICQAGL